MAQAPLSASLQPYLEKAIQAYTQGSHEYAVDLLTFIVKQAPDATEARRYLRLAIQKHHSQSPPSWASQAAIVLISVPFRLVALAHVLRGRWTRAIHLYEKLLCFQPRSKGLFLRLASSLSRAGHDEAAAATYEELLDLDPNHVPALRSLAYLSMKRGNDEQARRCFERILGLLPNDLDAQQGLRNLDALGTIKKGFSA